MKQKYTLNPWPNENIRYIFAQAKIYVKFTMKRKYTLNLCKTTIYVKVLVKLKYMLNL